MKVSVESSYFFYYFVHLIQKLFDQPLPAYATSFDVGVRRRLSIDWEGAIAELWPSPSTQTGEGSLLAAQMVVLHPLRWEGHCPLLRARLDAYKPWLLPMPPSDSAQHLSRDLVPGELQPTLMRFHALRHQLFRFLGANSAVTAMALRATFEALMAPVIANDRPRGSSPFASHIDVVKLADTEGLTPAQLDVVTAMSGPPPTFRTTLTEELSAMLRGERFGVVKDKNYLFTRHEGYAEHLEAVGDLTPFHNADVVIETDHQRRIELLAKSIRKTLRAKFHAANDVTASRHFANVKALRSATYNPEYWTASLRSDVSRSLSEHGGSARRRREAFPVERAPRKRREAVLETPPSLRNLADAVHAIWRDGHIYVNATDVKTAAIEGPTGLAWNEYVAFDQFGRVTHRLDDIDALYVHRGALIRYEAEALSRWLGNLMPTHEEWLRKTRNDGVEKRSALPFNRQQDTDLLQLWKPYQSKVVWESYAKEHGFKPAEVKRRSRFVAYATRHKNLTIAELTDLSQVERRLGPKAWEQWKTIARRACT